MLTAFTLRSIFWKTSKRQSISTQCKHCAPLVTWHTAPDTESTLEHSIEVHNSRRPLNRLILTLTLDQIFIGGRGIVMDYPCAKFGDFSFSRFGLSCRENHTHIDWDDCYTHATWVTSSTTLPPQRNIFKQTFLPKTPDAHQNNPKFTFCMGNQSTLKW